MTFSANGEHLLSGGLDQNIQVWQVQDGQRVATIGAKDLLCLAVSKNGKWIAGGTFLGDVFVWHAETYETKGHMDSYVYAIDFSRDSTTLVLGSTDSTATVWDVASGNKIRTLQHTQSVIAAKFSPNRIATATKDSVHIWDNHGPGQSLVDVPVTVTPRYNNGLLWFKNHIFVVSQYNQATGRIHRFNRLCMASSQ